MEQPPPLHYDDDGVGRPDWSRYRPGGAGPRRRNTPPPTRPRTLHRLAARLAFGAAVASLVGAGLWLMIFSPDIGASLASPAPERNNGVVVPAQLPAASAQTHSATTPSTGNTTSPERFPLCTDDEPHLFEEEVTEFGSSRWATHRHNLTVTARPDCWSGQVILPVGSWEIRVTVEGGNDTAYLLKQPSRLTQTPEPDDTVRQNGPIQQVTASAPFSEAGQRTKYRVRGTGDVHFCLVKLQMGHESDASNC